MLSTYVKENKKVLMSIIFTFLTVLLTVRFSFGKTLSLNGVTLNLDVETVKKSEPKGINVNDNISYSTEEFETVKKEEDKQVKVKLVIKNNNSFEKAKIKIESSIPKGFRLNGSNKNDVENVVVESNETKTYNYAYYYRDSFLKDQNNEWNYDENGNLIEESKNIRYETSSNGNSTDDKKTKNYDDKYVNKKIIESDKNRLNIGISKIIVVVISFVLALVVLFAIIMIYRSIKDKNIDSSYDGFNVFILIFISFMLINTILMKSFVFANEYSPQIYEYGKTYTKVISETVTFDELHYKFAYKITLEYEGIYNVSDEDYENDTDGDGLVDAFEYQYMTDRNNVDTDGDGLSDYIEVMLLDYNPLSMDTFNDGINDIDRDFDKDGLINSEEATYGTDMTLVDTDYDTLNDFEEINNYGTNPIEVDTDEDGLSDADELKLGLDPTNRMTDGVTLDSERKIEQSYNMEFVPSALKKGDIFIKGIDGAVAGIIDNSIKVRIKNESNLENSNCVVGNIFCIENENDYNLTITLDATKVSDRAGYIVVCKYEGGILVPIRTNCNSENELICDITSGTYCLADADLLLRELNIYNKDYEP